MTLVTKNLSPAQRQIIGEAYDTDESLRVKTHREAKKIAEDIADDEFLAIDEIESRKKSKDSYLDKCDEKGFLTPEQAKAGIRDTVGVRFITRYIDKIPLIFERIRKYPNVVLLEIKDYLSNPKENGYRGFHVIVQITIENQLVLVEFQIRTMAQHLWASFEHILRYKKPSLEISEAKNAVFRVISDKLNEIDHMIVKLRDDCEPDKVLDEKAFITDKIFEFATEATLVASNSESSNSALPRFAKGAPVKDVRVGKTSSGSIPLNIHRKKKAGKKKKKHH